jgi:23S rRNA pseudouridine2605 synthase
MATRLNKYVADCTGHSRRKADELIAAGKVKVNGKPAQVGQTINPVKDKVALEGQLLAEQKKRYILFHKPAGLITTRHDPEGRKTIYDSLPEKYHDLDPVGRLDRDTSGLLILSNDGKFVQELTHPRYEHQKTYRVSVDKTLTPEVLRQLEAGIHLMPEDKLATSNIQEIRDGKTVVIALKTGMNRQIRRCFEAVGYTVTDLKRLAFAGFTLGQLRPGQSREIKPFELRPYLNPRTEKPARKPRAKSPSTTSKSLDAPLRAKLPDKREKKPHHKNGQVKHQNQNKGHKKR